MKDFDKWNLEKKRTHFAKNEVIFYEREVWWSKLGVNVGVEIDGRHELFMRPVVIIRKFNKDMALVVPTTAKEKVNKYYFDIFGSKEKIFKACLSHIRIISSKRLLRKIDTVNEFDYKNLLSKISQMIQGLL